MIRRSEKSCKEGIRAFRTQHAVVHVSGIMHILPGYRGTYIRGVCTFGALQLQLTANFSKNWRGTYFRRGTYLRGFTVSSCRSRMASRTGWQALDSSSSDHDCLRKNFEASAFLSLCKPISCQNFQNGQDLLPVRMCQPFWRQRERTFIPSLADVLMLICFAAVGKQ